MSVMAIWSWPSAKVHEHAFDTTESLSCFQDRLDAVDFQGDRD